MKRKTSDITVNTTNPIQEYLDFQTGRTQINEQGEEWPSVVLPSGIEGVLKNNPDYRHGPVSYTHLTLPTITE